MGMAGSAGMMGTAGSAGMMGTAGSAGMMGMAGSSGMAGAAGGSSLGLRDVTVEMSGMTPHVGQLMEFRIVDASDQLIFRGIVDDLPSVSYTFIAPNSTPEGAYRVDFYADLSGNRTYDPPPTDHAWTLAVPTTGDAVLPFAHNTTFDDIDDPPITELGADFTFNATAMTPHVGQLFELRVYDQQTGRLVGRYVLTSIAAANFSLVIPGIIVDGHDYRVDFFADFSNNGSYDAPPTDHAWRVTDTGTASGLTLDFSHNAAFTDVGF